MNVLSNCFDFLAKKSKPVSVSWLDGVFPFLLIDFLLQFRTSVDIFLVLLAKYNISFFKNYFLSL